MKTSTMEKDGKDVFYWLKEYRKTLKWYKDRGDSNIIAKLRATGNLKKKIFKIQLEYDDNKKRVNLTANIIADYVGTTLDKIIK